MGEIVPCDEDRHHHHERDSRPKSPFLRLLPERTTPYPLGKIEQQVSAVEHRQGHEVQHKQADADQGQIVQKGSKAELGRLACVFGSSSGKF